MAKKERSSSQDFVNYETVKKAIIDAMVELRRINMQQENETKRAKREEWLSKIGYDKNKPLAALLSFFKMLLLKRKDVEGNRITNMLLSSTCEMLLFITYSFLLIISLLSLIGIVIIPFLLKDAQWPTFMLLAVTCLFSFVLGNLLRLSSYEIEKMEDKDYLNTILTTILTILGTLIAFIEIIRR